MYAVDGEISAREPLMTHESNSGCKITINDIQESNKKLTTSSQCVVLNLFLVSKTKKQQKTKQINDSI